MNDKRPLQPSDEGQPLPLQTILWVIGWAIVVALAGGVACGWGIVKIGAMGQPMMGLISLLLLGILAGAVAKGMTRRSVPWVGAMLAVAVLLAWFLAGAYWLRFAQFVGGKGAETLGAALRMFFTLPNVAPRFFYVGLICALLGAASAYLRAGSRWRM